MAKYRIVILSSGHTGSDSVVFKASLSYRDLSFFSNFNWNFFVMSYIVWEEKPRESESVGLAVTFSPPRPCALVALFTGLRGWRRGRGWSSCCRVQKIPKKLKFLKLPEQRQIYFEFSFGILRCAPNSHFCHLQPSRFRDKAATALVNTQQAMSSWR